MNLKKKSFPLSFNIYSSLSYTATVNSVVIYEDSVTTNISSSENEHSIDPAPFAQSGATVGVTVQARVMDSFCDPMSASLMISGGWYDAVVYMYNA